MADGRESVANHGVVIVGIVLSSVFLLVVDEAERLSGKIFS